MSTQIKSAFADRKMVKSAVRDSFIKLNPKTQAKNPVMFWFTFPPFSQLRSGWFHCLASRTRQAVTPLPLP